MAGSLRLACEPKLTSGLLAGRHTDTKADGGPSATEKRNRRADGFPFAAAVGRLLWSGRCDTGKRQR